MRDILPSLPDEPLVVKTLKVTSKKQKVADDITKIMQKILSQLNYKKCWTIGLKKQINNKTDFTFKLIGRHKNSIICRLKPGDNSTCWDIFLNPPTGYLVDDVVTSLKQIPLNGEIIHLPEARMVNKILGIGKSRPKLPEVAKQPLEPPKAIVPPLEPPKAIVPPLEPPKAIVPPLEPPNEEASFEPSDDGSFFDDFFGSLFNRSLAKKPPQAGWSLLDDDNMLNAGLIAVCMGIDPTNLYIQREFAIQIIHQKLDLENFIKTNANYNKASRAAGIVTRGIVNKGWLSRLISPQRKKGPRIRDTTKGYLLTPAGREKLNSLVYSSDAVPWAAQEIKPQLFRPDLIVIQNKIEIIDEDDLDLPVPTQPQSPVVVKSTPSTPTSNKSSRVEDLIPLFKEFETRKKAIEECDGFIQECLESEKEIDNSFDVLKNKLLRIKSEQAELEAQLGSLKGKRDKIYEDLESFRSLKEEESKVLNDVKSKLGSALS